MEKVLRKRAWRDLKENKFRYFALAFLIIISMYLVISLVGAADTIVDGTTKQAKKHKLEDGPVSYTHLVVSRIRMIQRELQVVRL